MEGLSYKGIPLVVDDDMTGGAVRGYMIRTPVIWPGQTYKVGLYWVEVVGYSPKTRNVRYRRITGKGKPLAPVESMGRKRFEREAVRA